MPGNIRYIISTVTFLSLIMLLLPSYADCKTLYRWTDRRGQDHITDYPPPEGSAVPGSIESVDVKEAAPDVKDEKKKAPFSGSGQLDEIERESAELMDRMKRELDLTGLEGESLSHYLNEVRMLSSSVLILAVIMTLFFHFIYSLPLYLISRKMALSYAWLSWVPMFNIFPLAGSARLPLWVGIFFLLPLLASLPVASGSSAVLLAFILVALADLILIVAIWIRICRNLWVNQWAGLLILLPVFQLILPWYLALKTDPEHLIRSDIRRLRTSLLALGVFLALSLTVSLSMHFYGKPVLEGLIDAAEDIQNR